MNLNMGKHIDSEKLKTEIERRRKFHDDAIIKFCNNRTIALTHSAGLKEDEKIVVLIDSLQQEQDILVINKKDWEVQEQFRKNKKFVVPLQEEQQDFPTTDEQVKEILATHPKVEVPNKYKTPDWLWKKQEQSDVDLEKELDKFYGMYRKDGKTYDITNDEEVSDWKENGNFLFEIEIARYFYELGLNARKEK